MATVFSLVVAVQRVLLGPHAFVRLGMSWTEIVAIYYVGLALGGCAYGALRPLSQYLPVAMLSGVLLVLPVCLSLGVFLGLGLNKTDDVEVAVTLGAAAAFLIGAPLGIMNWTDEQAQTGDQGVSGEREGTGAHHSGGKTNRFRNIDGDRPN
jgi:hypothetical protein